MSKYPKRLIEVDLPIKRISAHSRREKSIRYGHISTLHIWWARRPLAACRAVTCAALWPDPADALCPQTFRDKAKVLLLKLAAHFINGIGGSDDLVADLKNDIKSSDKAKRAAAYKQVEQREKYLCTFLSIENSCSSQELRECLLEFIAWSAGWEQSTLPKMLETSQALTQAAHEALGGMPGTRPLVVDPFAGGGSIPLEALRVGADAFASDLNPVAVLLNKVVLEYIPKYGQHLADEVRKWGHWIKQEAEAELGSFYPKDSDGGTPIAYIWSRTILSEAPTQDHIPIEIPLLRSMWLAKQKGRNFAFRWVRDDNHVILTETVEISYSSGEKRTVRRPLLEIYRPEKGAEVENGTSSGGAVTCPITGYTTPVESVRVQLKQRGGGAQDSRLVCVVKTFKDKKGRFYSLPTQNDLDAIEKSCAYLKSLQALNMPLQDMEIPNGELNHLRGFFNIVLYGIETWGQAFNYRQILMIFCLIKYVRKVGKRLEEDADPDFATAVETLLSLVIDRMADGNSSLSRWQSTGQKISNTFGRQALPMVWDYCEANPFCDATRSLDSMFEWVIRVVEHEACNSHQGKAENFSATQHVLPDDSVDAFISDPPYYAAVPYADLSDFFYSWLKISLKDRHPDLFTSTLTPKKEELVSLSHRAAMYRYKDNKWFEDGMEKLAAKDVVLLIPKA